MTRRAPGGQAAVEVLALLPLLVVVVLLGWQLAAIVSAGMRADAKVRAAALTAPGGAGVATVAASAPAPSLLPGLGELRVPARIGVRAP